MFKTLTNFLIIFFLTGFVISTADLQSKDILQGNAFDMLFNIAQKGIMQDSQSNSMSDLKNSMDNLIVDGIYVPPINNIDTFLDSVDQIVTIDTLSRKFVRNTKPLHFLLSFNEFSFLTLVQTQFRLQDLYHSLSSEEKVNYMIRLLLIKRQLSYFKTHLLESTLQLYPELKSTQQKKQCWNAIDRMMETVDLKKSETGNQIVQRSPYGIVTESGSILNYLRARMKKEQNEEIKTLAGQIIQKIENAESYYKKPEGSKIKFHISEVLSQERREKLLAADYFHEAFQSKNNLDKIEKYTRSIQHNPDFSPSYYNRGIAYYETGRFSEAIQDFDKAMELEPESAMTYLYRGICYQKLGQPDRAVTDFTLAMAYDPHPVQAHNQRGMSYQKMEEYLMAIRDYNWILKYQPENITVLLNRGYCLQKLDYFKEAIAQYKKVLEVSPLNAPAYYNLGRIYWMQGKWEKVVEAWEKCLEIDPNQQYVLNNLPTAKVNAIWFNRPQKRTITIDKKKIKK